MRQRKSFADYVPDSDEKEKFSVRFFEGRAQSASSLMWILSTHDLTAMFASFEHEGSTTLWCEGKTDEVGKSNKQSSNDSVSDDGTPTSKKAIKKGKVSKLKQALSTNHGDRFSKPQYRLWAQMVITRQ